MTTQRWWLLALAATALICLGVMGLSVGIGPRSATGAAILLAYLVFWMLVFRPDIGGSRQGMLVLGVTIITAGALTSVDTSLAFFQGFAFPAIWCTLRTLRSSVIASAVLALVEIVGFLLSLGISSNSVVLAVTVEAISFVFAIAMGAWISQISELSDERGRLLDELTAAQEQLAVLHRDAGATGERERLARELHDTIAQSLTGQVLVAQRSRRELAAGTLKDSTLEVLETASREALAETRTLVAASARVELPGGGLAEALQALAARFERESGITVRVVSTLPSSVPLARDAEVVLLRCAQEGLANIRKHAGAHEVRVTVSTTGGFASVTVVDDGHGFDPEHAASGFGLTGLRDRLGLVGGELSIDGTAGATTLTARLPLVAVS